MCDAIEFIEACGRGELGYVQMVVDDVGEQEWIFEGFHAACCEGHLDIVKFICENGYNNINPNDCFGIAVRSACEHGRLDVLKYLIDKYEIKPDVETWGLNDVFTTVCYRGHTEIARIILSLAPIDVKYKDDRAFRWACEEKRWKLADLILLGDPSGVPSKSNYDKYYAGRITWGAILKHSGATT